MNKRAGALLVFVSAAVAAPTGGVCGRVLDADGKEMPSVWVTARAISVEVVIGTGVTGKDGRYVIKDLPPGEYVLFVNDPSRKGKITAGELFGGGLLPDLKGNPDRVVVTAGAPVEHDIRIRRKLTVVVAVARDNRPLGRAAVWLDALDERGLRALRTPQDEPLRTDDSGEASFPDVAEGAYGISLDLGEWEVRCARIDVKGKEPLKVPVAVGGLEARVRIVDAKGKPVTAAKPSLKGDGWHEVSPKDSIASATGVYAIPGVAEGRYVPSAIVDGVLARGEPFAFAPGSPEVTLTLPPTGSLVVKVVDAAGKPVRDRTVNVDHASGIPSLFFETGPNGEIRVGYLTVGKWVVGVLGRPGTRTVEVKAGAEAKVMLKP